MLPLNLFQNLDVACTCYPGPQPTCVCSHEERVLRRYSEGIALRPMSPRERQLIAEEAASFEECNLSLSELLLLPDKDLAKTLLGVWNEYVR